VDIEFIGKKGKYLDTTEKFYIYQETKKIYNRIFEVLLENQQVS
jgi:hypothetical protein